MAAIEGKRISELANNASIDGTAIFPHTQNGSTMRVSLSNITDYILAQVDEDTVKDAVNEWMTDHPDVTTTVQDGAISTAKLANDAVTSEKIKNGTIAGIDLSIDLLDAICASGSASGSVATFHDGAYGLPLKSCIVSVNPVQSGSGDPSPTNIRPITGWDGAEVVRTGKNLIDDLTATLYPRYFNSNNKWGYASDSTSFAFRCLPNTTYTISAYNPNLTVFRTGYIKTDIPTSTSGADGPNIYSILRKTASGSTVITTGADATYIVIQVNSAIATARTTQLQIEYGSTATAYEPYNGTVYPVTWSEAGTVYGGTLDVINGVLTKTHEIRTFNGSETFTRNVNGYFYIEAGSTAIAPNLNAAESTGWCSHYKLVTDITANDFYATDLSTMYCMSNISSAKRIYFTDSNYSTAEAFKAYLQAQYTAGTPVQYVFKLAEPVTYQLTPTEITTLIGENNIWTECGDISVEYFANTQIYIEQRINATKSIITGVEAGFVATKNYAIGDLMIVGDTLYIATAAIANGGTITPGTNVTNTTVAENLGGSLPSA